VKIASIRLLARWLAGVLAFLVADALVAGAFDRTILALTTPVSVSRFAVRAYQLQIAAVSACVFLECLFWGAVYVSAMAKPASFGGTARIWKHLGLSYALGIIGCILLIRALLLPLPDFQSDLALSGFPFLLVAMATICFLLAAFTWARLAFAGRTAIRAQAGIET